MAADDEIALAPSARRRDGRRQFLSIVRQLDRARLLHRLLHQARGYVAQQRRHGAVR